MTTNVKEGDVARVVQAGEYRGLIVTVGSECGLGTFLNGEICWHTSHSCSHALPDRWLRRLADPGDDVPTQETRPLPIELEEQTR